MITPESKARWEKFAEPGQCDYCGKHTLVQPEPFGWKSACQECWELICFGEEENDRSDHASGTAS